MLGHHVRVDRVRAFAANLEAMVNVVRAEWLGGAEVEISAGLTTVLAICFMLVIALINLRGVAESVYANIVLTCVELTGLLIVIFVGFYAFTQGKADLSRVVMFDTPEDKSIFIAVTTATSLAFFAMVGFEDSVNMAEEVHEPSKVFPKILLTGLGITGLIYILVSITAIALVPAGELGEGDAPLLKVVNAGAPDLPGRRHLPADQHVRGGEHRPDQHAHGQPPAVRDGPPARAAAGARPRAPRAAVRPGSPSSSPRPSRSA